MQFKWAMLVVHANSKVVNYIPPWAHKSKVFDPVETCATNSFLKPKTCAVSQLVVYPSITFQVFKCNRSNKTVTKACATRINVSYCVMCQWYHMADSSNNWSLNMPLWLEDMIKCNLVLQLTSN